MNKKVLSDSICDTCTVPEMVNSGNGKDKLHQF
jgi:hypothetical protein